MSLNSSAYRLFMSSPILANCRPTCEARLYKNKHIHSLVRKEKIQYQWIIFMTFHIKKYPDLVNIQIIFKDMYCQWVFLNFATETFNRPWKDINFSSCYILLLKLSTGLIFHDKNPSIASCYIGPRHTTNLMGSDVKAHSSGTWGVVESRVSTSSTSWCW